MHRIVTRGLAALVLACLPVVAGATAQRTFVRSDGVDNPACSLAAPCRAFAAAVTATSSGGEVIVLDSGGYGAVTIAKSLSIASPLGIYAGISVFSDTGIGVDGAGITVELRGLTLCKANDTLPSSPRAWAGSPRTLRANAKVNVSKPIRGTTHRVYREGSLRAQSPELLTRTASGLAPQLVQRCEGRSGLPYD